MSPSINEPSSGPLCPPRATAYEGSHKGADTQESLLSDLPDLNVEPLWTKMTRLNPPLPDPKATVHVWKYSSLRPHLLRAGELVTAKQAERRVLMLINPAMQAPNTTDTLYAGMQLVMPGEVAPAHRHTAFACRFIVEGEGGYTAVHGKRITMHRGDFIITPKWEFHDHGNAVEGSPMIWLDGLDLPQFQHYPVHFVQHYDKPKYPAEEANSSSIIFPWSEVQKKHDANVGAPHSIVRYTSQEPGAAADKEVSDVIGAQTERVNAGHTTKSVQETSSAVYHVIDGEGSSQIGDKTVQWTKGDTFTVPSWQAYSHSAKTLSYLYRFDDKPQITSLGFYRNGEEDFMRWD